MKNDRRRKHTSSAQQNGLVQLKATLCHVRPLVWRRLLVAEGITLGDLHNILQVAFGWTNSHLHQFIVDGKTYGPHGPEYEEVGDLDYLDESEFRLSKLASPGAKFTYEYDFGDGWEHEIVVEEVQARDGAAPRCLAGARACPPEDCGGPGGYADLLEAIRDPSHDRHDELVDWVGGAFDPKRFDLAAVNRELETLSSHVRSPPTAGGTRAG